MRSSIRLHLLVVVGLLSCDGGRLDPTDWPEVPPGYVAPDGVAGDATGGDSVGTCTPTRQFWQTDVWDAFMGTRCTVCHIDGGLAGATRLVLDTGGTQAALDTNFASASAMALVEEGGQRLLLAKPTNGVAHGGGPQLTAASADHQALVAFVGRIDAPVPCDSVTPTPDPTPELAPDVPATPDVVADVVNTPDVGPDLPSTPMTWRFEGEDSTNTFINGVGSVSGSAYHMWTGDTIANTVDVPVSGDYTLGAAVWEDYCCNEPAQWALVVDGADEATGTTSATDQSSADLVTTTVTLTAGQHTIGVRFLNDANDATDDRNLWIDYFELYGPLP